MDQCNSNISRHTTWLKAVLPLTSLKDLEDCNLPDRIIEALRALSEQTDQQPPEEHIVVAFLWMLYQSPLGKSFSRTAKRAVKKAKKKLDIKKELMILMSELFSDISRDDWGKQFPLEFDLRSINDPEVTE